MQPWGKYGSMTLHQLPSVQQVYVPMPLSTCACVVVMLAASAIAACDSSYSCRSTDSSCSRCRQYDGSVVGFRRRLWLGKW